MTGRRTREDEGNRAVVYLGDPIHSGCVLIRRDHLVNVTSLEHERWKRAHPSSAGRWEPHRARPGSVTDHPGYRLAIHRTASCAVTVADASAAQRREHGAWSLHVGRADHRHGGAGGAGLGGLARVRRGTCGRSRSLRTGLLALPTALRSAAPNSWASIERLRGYYRRRLDPGRRPGRRRYSMGLLWDTDPAQYPAQYLRCVARIAKDDLTHMRSYEKGIDGAVPVRDGQTCQMRAGGERTRR